MGAGGKRKCFGPGKRPYHWKSHNIAQILGRDIGCFTGKLIQIIFRCIFPYCSNCGQRGKFYVKDLVLLINMSPYGFTIIIKWEMFRCLRLSEYYEHC